MAKAKYWEYVDGRGNRWQAIVTPVETGYVSELDRVWGVYEGMLDDYTSQWIHYPMRRGFTYRDAVAQVARSMGWRKAVDVDGGVLPLEGAMLDAYNETIRRIGDG